MDKEETLFQLFQKHHHKTCNSLDCIKHDFDNWLFEQVKWTLKTPSDKPKADYSGGHYLRVLMPNSWTSQQGWKPVCEDLLAKFCQKHNVQAKIETPPTTNIYFFPQRPEIAITIPSHKDLNNKSNQ